MVLWVGDILEQKVIKVGRDTALYNIKQLNHELHIPFYERAFIVELPLCVIVITYTRPKLTA